MIVREIRGSLFISQWYPRHRPQAGPEFTREENHVISSLPAPSPLPFPSSLSPTPRRGKLHEEQLYLTEIHASVRAYVFPLVAVQS